MARLEPHSHKQQTRNIGLFLALVVLVQFGYPITVHGRGWLLLYQSFYALMFVSGGFIARERPWQLWLNAASAATFFVFNLWYVAAPENDAANIAAYFALIPFHLLIIYSLFRFTEIQTRVNAATFMAAVAIYLLLGALFVPLYGALEIFFPGSFIDTSPESAELVWQQLIYYSYVTLNTIGYGDILPVTLVAKSLSTLEGTLGVLYIAFVIARLVNLYDRDDGTESKRDRA